MRWNFAIAMHGVSFWHRVADCATPCLHPLDGVASVTSSAGRHSHGLEVLVPGGENRTRTLSGGKDQHGTPLFLSTELFFLCLPYA
jgi:hypothetical protein